jgi:NAD(P)-dependent dehydrogenase (short-subunit alcohol dehydrogenase family)
VTAAGGRGIALECDHGDPDAVEAVFERVARESELRAHGVTVVVLRPGLVRTEGVVQFSQWLDMSVSESPEYTGRVVVALATDPNVAARTGRTFDVGALADAYGVDDVDRTRPGPLEVEYLR